MHDSYCSCIFCSIRVAIIFRCCGKNFLNKKFRVNSTKLESKPTRVFDITPSSDDFSSENDFLDRPRATFFGSRTVWGLNEGSRCGRMQIVD